MTGLIDFYYSYRDTIRDQASKLAELQLNGRLEDYFVKEFAHHVHQKGSGEIGTKLDCGLKGEQKIDVCLIEKESNGSKCITGMLEFKYVRNRHGTGRMGGAEDEITTYLNQLRSQVHSFARTSHGKFQVKLNSKRKTIYGLVLASYVCDSRDDVDKERFYKRVMDEGSKNFQYHDLKQRAYLKPIYEDVEVVSGGTRYFCTLRAGLWVKKPTAS